MKDLSARHFVAIALIMSGSFLIGGSRIYSVLYLPQSKALSVWPLWVVALVPVTAGFMLLRSMNSKSKQPPAPGQ